MAQFKTTDKQAIRDWEAYYQNFVAAVSAEKDETEGQRKERVANLEKDPVAWNQYYFPKYCYAPPADFHVKAIKRQLNNPEWYECDVWARELAKDVVEMMITLNQVLTKKKRSVMFISNSWDSAADLLQPYKINLERNERIINDYGMQAMPGSWKRGDFTTTQGVSFLAVGADQSPRGTRDEEVRPDKVIISDIDTDEDCRNSETIKKRWEWFEKAVFPTRSVSKDFQVIWLNNLIAKDSCMVRAMKMADYVSKVNLEDKNGNSTWPEKNKPEHIARIKSKISTKAYQGEYMNNPLSEGDVFKEMTWGKCPPLKYMPFVVNYSDPSTSNKDKQKSGASYKAQFLIGYKNGKFYVYTGFLEQVKQATFVQWFWSQNNYVDGKTQVYHLIENNSLQDPFYQQVIKPAIQEKCETDGFVPVSPDERDKPEKAHRIEGMLEPLNRDGQLILNEAEKNNPHMIRLEEQFKLFTMQLKSPADGPDCIEGGVWIINQKLAALTTDSYSIGKRKSGKKRY
jgi:hypothetical protein